MESIESYDYSEETEEKVNIQDTNLDVLQYFKNSDESFSKEQEIELRKQTSISSETPLTIEEFSLIRNNFHLYFCPKGDNIVWYPDKENFRLFQKHNPEMVEKITKIVSNIVENPELQIGGIYTAVSAYMPLMYETYLVFRSYVDCDKEIFS